ncbi:MAG: T9SS type A sorting domain-containing protein [Chitinophagales bacterium]
MKNGILQGFLLLFSTMILMLVLHPAYSQTCIPPVKQVVLFDQFGNYYVYWKPASGGGGIINYKVQVMCTGLPACFFSVSVTNANVLKMNGGYLGVKIPALPTSTSTVKLSIFPPGCPDQFTAAFVESLDIITDNLDIIAASCDSDTCKLVVSKWNKLKSLTDYANSKCGGGGLAVPATTVTAIDAPISISLRKNDAGKWQMKTTDTLLCDSCYVFNFQITCSNGTVYYVQDTICFNYTGPEIGCRQAGITAGEQSFIIYPNPTTDRCTIQFNLAQTSSVALIVYNSLGKQVHIVEAGELEEGQHDLDFTISDLPAGLYIAEIRTNDQLRRMKLLKF